jgi:ribosomal protein L22
MSDETPKDAEPETPEVEEAAATEAAADEEAKPKPRRRSRAKKAEESDAPAAEEGAEEEAPKPRRSRRKKADEEAAPEPVAEEEADEIEPTPEEIEAADEAASEEELDEDEDADEGAEEAAPAARRRRGRGAAEPAEEAPATRRTREPRRPAPGERVLVRAQAKYVRTSARKARLVCDHIRGKSVQEARAILAHTPRAVARDWSKLLESAVANAEHNHELLGDDLRIASVTADEGPTLKRFRPRAMGRATRIRKRTSHLTILLTPKEF